MLDVRAMPCVVPPGVFDAWAWCPSDVLEWRRPISSSGIDLAVGGSIEGQNPSGLVFVMRDHPSEVRSLLPSELARLHAFGYGLEDELALAPYAIDDATDLLFEHRTRPGDVFWLAADSLEALVWGLHDWTHFHNHGPFDQPAMTELQCDLIALAWLRANADRIRLGRDHLTRVARDLAALSRRRFCEEGVRPPTNDLDALFLGPYPQAHMVGERPVRASTAAAGQPAERCRDEGVDGERHEL
jgi:hypothetical protein